ncbi:TPA: TrkH family potassium uptake protein [Candidatus Bipolaricaulota bacterium]|nr:TrkH family potassium uptake protein [Candidatus Bipolaricaulota bacterium]
MGSIARLGSPLGYLLLILAASTLAPALVAGLAGEWRELAWFIALGAGAGLLGELGVRTQPVRPLTEGEALPLTALAYLLFSLLGALPFLTVGSFLDGWFEAASGITTTGLSVFTPEALPRSLILFRSLYQWLGGAGIVVISLALLLPPGRTALALYAAEYGGENLAGNVRLTARRVAWVYAALTGAGFFAYLAAGMGPFDAGVHVLSTISTGGFSPYSDSIGHYASPAVEGVVSLFMLAGAISFPLFWLLRPGKARAFLRERQLTMLFGLSLVLGLLVGGGIGSLGAGFFQGISALTTTGFTTLPTPTLSPPARWLLLLGMVIGGCGGSTAGGVKLFRLLALLALVRWLLVRARLPREAEVPLRMLGENYPQEEALRMAAYILLYLGLLAVATAALVYWGYPPGDALFEAASAQGTVGLSMGIAGPGAPAGVKLILIALMWMGRLEVLPVLLLVRKAVRVR